MLRGRGSAWPKARRNEARSSIFGEQEVAKREFVGDEPGEQSCGHQAEELGFVLR